MSDNQIASRVWVHGQSTVFYVSETPNAAVGGADWGYTTQASKALPLSPYWARRFASDCRAVGYRASFYPASR